MRPTLAVLGFTLALGLACGSDTSTAPAAPPPPAAPTPAAVVDAPAAAPAPTAAAPAAPAAAATTGASCCIETMPDGKEEYFGVPGVSSCASDQVLTYGSKCEIVCCAWTFAGTTYERQHGGSCHTDSPKGSATIVDMSNCEEGEAESEPAPSAEPAPAPAPAKETPMTRPGSSGSSSTSTGSGTATGSGTSTKPSASGKRMTRPK